MRSSFGVGAAIAAITFSFAATQALAEIQVVSAVYGANCGADSDVTSHVASICDGRGECVYHVNHRVIGDPAVGCVKNFSVRWSCGGAHVHFRSVGGYDRGEASGQEVFLGCR